MRTADTVTLDRRDVVYPRGHGQASILPQGRGPRVTRGRQAALNRVDRTRPFGPVSHGRSEVRGALRYGRKRLVRIRLGVGALYVAAPGARLSGLVIDDVSETVRFTGDAWFENAELVGGHASSTG